MEVLERTYTTMDRAEWGAGPWDGEPDKVQWVDAATGLDCLAVRNRMGAWCGYVGVPETHPWFNIDYSDNADGDDAEGYCWEHSPDYYVRDVHGGLTYSGFCQTGPEAETICHLPFDGRPDRVWWFGFDTAHGGDLMPRISRNLARMILDDDADRIRGIYRDLAYVREHCATLARQLAAVN